MYKLINIIIFLIAIMVGVSLSLVNTQMVEFNYYFGEVSIQLSLLVAITFISGFIFCFLISIPAFIKLKVYISRNNKNRQEQSAKPDIPLIKPEQS